MAKWSKKILSVADPIGSAVARRNKKFGSIYKKATSWGYLKKKIGVNRLFGSSVNSAASYAGSSDVYGSTGSIVGRF